MGFSNVANVTISSSAGKWSNVRNATFQTGDGAWTNVANVTFNTAISGHTVSSVEDVATGASLLWWGRPAYIHGDGFRDTQGTSFVTIEDSLGNEEQQPVTQWTAERITIMPTRGSLLDGKFIVHVDRT